MTDFSLKRRTLLKSAAAFGGALAAPAFISSKALASSGELNILTYAGFDGHKAVFDAFTAETGITVKAMGQPDSDSIFAQAKLANAGELDLIDGISTYIPLYQQNGLVQALDPAKLELANITTGMPGTVEGDDGWIDGSLYYLSLLWGGEGMAYSSEVEGQAYGEATLATLFDPAYEGAVTVRDHSSMAAMGRVLEAEGKLPMPFRDSYKDEASMRAVWDVVLAEVTKHKANIVQFWTNDNEGVGAFVANGAKVGLVWESIGRTLADQDSGVRWIAPKEGAFGWNQGHMLAKNAANTEQAYEYLKWISRPQNGVKWGVANQGLSSSNGAVDLLEGQFKDFTLAAYPGDAAQKMWWWPAQAPWFIKLRGEYADRFRSA